MQRAWEFSELTSCRTQRLIIQKPINLQGLLGTAVL